MSLARSASECVGYQPAALYIALRAHSAAFGRARLTDSNRHWSLCESYLNAQVPAIRAGQSHCAAAASCVYQCTRKCVRMSTRMTGRRGRSTCTRANRRVLRQNVKTSKRHGISPIGGRQRTRPTDEPLKVTVHHSHRIFVASYRVNNIRRHRAY